MTIAEKLDLAIKLKETGTTDGAYVVKRGNGEKTSKTTYMTKEEWITFEDGNINAIENGINMSH